MFKQIFIQYSLPMQFLMLFLPCQYNAILLHYKRNIADLRLYKGNNSWKASTFEIVDAKECAHLI